MTDPDLTAELDAAEDIVTGRVEKVETEWGVRRWEEGREHWYGSDAEAERIARAVALDHEKSGTPGVLVRRTVTYGPSEAVAADPEKPEADDG
jgi:hypothetical protein